MDYYIPQIWTGSQWIFFEDLLAWYESPQGKTEFILKSTPLPIESDAMTMKTKISVAKKLDKVSKQTRFPSSCQSTKFESIEESLQCFQSQKELPRIGVGYLHFKKGSFPLNRVVNYEITRNEIKLFFDPQFHYTSLSLEVSIASDLVDKIQNAIDGALCLTYSKLFLIECENLKEKLPTKDAKLSTLISSYYHRLLIHLEFLSKCFLIKSGSDMKLPDMEQLLFCLLDKRDQLNSSGSKTVPQQMRMMSQFIKCCVDALNRNDADYKGWNTCFSIILGNLIFLCNSVDSVELQLDELMKQIQNALDNTKFDSTDKSNIFCDYKNQVKKHTENVNNYPYLYDKLSQFIKLCKVLEELLLIVDTKNDKVWIKSEIDAKISEYELFPTPANQLEKMIDRLTDDYIKSATNTTVEFFRLITNYRKIIGDFMIILKQNHFDLKQTELLFDLVDGCLKSLNDTEHSRSWWVGYLEAKEKLLMRPVLSNYDLLFTKLKKSVECYEPRDGKTLFYYFLDKVIKHKDQMESNPLEIHKLSQMFVEAIDLIEKNISVSHCDSVIEKLLSSIDQSIPKIMTKENICNQKFSGQLFIYWAPNATPESIAQKIIGAVSDKAKCRFFLFTSVYDWLWVSIEGKNQKEHDKIFNDLFEHDKQVTRCKSWEYEPHISPGMLKSGKPFEYNIVTIERPCSFFIHGDSSYNWTNLYALLEQEIGKCQTLLFQSRKKDRVPGTTLYVCTNKMTYSTPEQLLQKIDTNNEFSIISNYSEDMIDIVIQWQHNDVELIQKYPKI